MGLLNDLLIPTTTEAIRGVRRLIESADPQSASTLQNWFKGEKEAVKARLTRGQTDRFGQRNIMSETRGMDTITQELRLEHEMVQRFQDYEEMDNYPEVSSALDLYADDATIPDAINSKSIWVVSEDAAVREALTYLLHNVLRIEEDIWSGVRGLSKYGNQEAEVLVTAEDGVIGLNWLPPPSVRRIETPKGQLVGFLQDDSLDFRFDWGSIHQALHDVDQGKQFELPTHLQPGLTFFEPWEVVHWRLRSKQMRAIHGYSVMDTVRWVWRRLVMMEDTMLLYKLTRAPARFAHFIEVGDLPPEEAMAYVNAVKREHRKKKTMRTDTSQLDFKVNPFSLDEDFWVPSRAGSDATRIEVISGPDYQIIDDVQYFQTKMLSAMKTPASYLGLGGETNKAALSQEDVRFARTTLRIQREWRNGIRQVCRIHLAALGIDPDQVDWEIQMTTPSSIFELAQIEVLNAKADMADRLGNWLPREWILRNVFKFTDEAADEMMTTTEGEQRRSARFNAEVQDSVIRDFPAAAGMMPPVGAPAQGGAPMESVNASPQTLRESEARLERFLTSWEERMGKRLPDKKELREHSGELRKLVRRLDRQEIERRHTVSRSRMRQAK